MKLGEFVIDLVVDSATGELSVKDLVRGFGELEVATLGEIGALTTIVTKLAGVAQAAMATAAVLSIFTTTTGLSAQELQHWQIVAQQANVSAEAVASTVESLTANLAAIRLGQGNIAPFQALGLDPSGKNAFAVLDELRERIKGLSAPVASNILRQMGIDPAMLAILRLTNAEFSKLAKAAHGMTPQQEAAFLRMKEAMTKFQLGAADLGRNIAVYLVEPTVRWLDIITKSAQYLAPFVNDLKMLGTVLAVIYAPFLALLLILDDIVTYFRGGNSVTGEAVKAFKKMVDEIENVIDSHPTLKKFLEFMTASATTKDAIKDAPKAASMTPSERAATAEDIMNMGMSHSAATAGVVSPMVNASVPGVSKSVQQTNTFNQTIHSTAPAADVARDSVSSFMRQLDEASNSLETGERK